MARFDWYQATVPASVADLQAALSGVADGGAWSALAKPRQGYGAGMRLDDAGGRVCELWWGGMQEHPHVVATGETTPGVADVLRADFPVHRVSRADVCIDYAEPGAYDRLQDLALGVAGERGIKVGTAGDHLLTRQGRTAYFGSTKSHTMLRLYDKAAELRAKFQHDPARLLEVPAELARLECQVRPQTPQAKAAAAVAAPLALMGSAAWMRALMGMVAGIELEPFQAGRVWRQADDARAYAALLAQYGGLLQRLQDDLGSWECLGLQMRDDLAERARLKRRGLPV